MTHAAFNLAFDEWMRAEYDRQHQLWHNPSYDESGVSLTLNRFSPRHQHFVSARLSRSKATCLVEWDFEPWGELVAFDVDVQRVDGGWRDQLSSPEGTVYLQQQSIWRDQLFEPLRDWVEAHLQTADVLHLHRRKHHHWSTLAHRDTIVPETACLTVYRQEIR